MSLRQITFSIILSVALCGLLYAKVQYPFEGTLDLTQKEMSLKLDLNDKSFLVFEIHEKTPSEYEMHLKAERIKTKLFDLSTEITGHITLEQDGLNPFRINGLFQSQDTLFNFKPLNELDCSLSLEKDKLYINKCAYGLLAGQGAVYFEDHPHFDVVLQLINVPLDKAIPIMYDNIEDSFYIEGLVNGFQRIKGSLDGVHLSGDLSSFNARMGKYEASSIFVKYKGLWPDIQVYDTTVATKEGMSFLAEGPLDFRRREDLIDQILRLTRKPIIEEGEHQTEWVIKHLRAEDALSETQTKYFIRENDSNNQGSSDNGDLFGIEHSVGF